ncbi:MAG: hypothetical protein LBI80_03440 [Endomicrobium sp.]|nr:hypothetical protein [Endomicrobium sp.]
MNYMKMINFLEVSPKKSISRFIYRESEEISSFDIARLAPFYSVIEAIFQTAGAVARAFTENKKGGYIVNFSNLKLKRPVMMDELIIITANFISYSERQECFFLKTELKTALENDILVNGCDLIIKQDKSITTGKLNNIKKVNNQEYLLSLGFGE